MASKTDYEDKIRKCTYYDIRKMWREHNEGKIDAFWQKGKLLEYVVLRAFELEGKEKSIEVKVTYPYYLIDKRAKKIGEQTDGFLQVGHLYAMIESKDYTKKRIGIGPIDILRGKISNRQSLFGMFFSISGYTAPAVNSNQARDLMILLWRKEDINFCLENGCFIDCMKEKHDVALRCRDFDYKYSDNHSDKILPKCYELF